ncbi:hypothetical protein GWG54_17020 [Natronococcus sp. JC468]|uniref:hypothetical protein n=1 Tax=Natronococcus sp. JC468 TaxID=1961921 RepID=UPI00143C79D3|nr:hypothetical protein [Natronococcus sp. JC468]NKE37478.1 hypothetical protein [Natronococcus sp. JC468]
MDRRKVLLSSGAAFTTILAGCSNETGSENSDSSENGAANGQADNGKTEDEKNGGEKNGNKEKTEKEEKNGEDEKEGGDEQEDEKGDEKEADEIPGFDRAKCELNSDLIQIKELAYHDQKLEVCVVVTTTDRAALREELLELAPALERGVTDAEAFLAELEEVKLTVQNEARETILSAYLDVQWLREFLNDDMTNEELASRVRSQLEQE